MSTSERRKEDLGSYSQTVDNPTSQSRGLMVMISDSHGMTSSVQMNPSYSEGSRFDPGRDYFCACFGFRLSVFNPYQSK